MTIEQLEKAHEAKPFQPFIIRTADGREFGVNHPENLYRTPQGRTIVIADEKVDAVDIIDLLLVASLDMKPRRNGVKHASGKV